jgi:soluble lytic murein transglycosylase
VGSRDPSSSLDSPLAYPYKNDVNRRRLSTLALLVTVGLAAVGWGYGYWRAHRFDGCIRTAARRYGVDPALVKAVVWQESRFRPRAVGRAEEYGLMQVRELAAVEWSTSQGVRGFELEHLFDPGTNTLAGTWYLARLLKRYARTDDPLPYALADYNAGRGHVLRWNQGVAETNAAAFVEQIGFPGTRRYVENVVRRRDEYRSDFYKRD